MNVIYGALCVDTILNIISLSRADRNRNPGMVIFHTGFALLGL